MRRAVWQPGQGAGVAGWGLITDEGLSVGGASDSDIGRSAVVGQDRRMQRTVGPCKQSRAIVGLGFPLVEFHVHLRFEAWVRITDHRLTLPLTPTA